MNELISSNKRIRDNRRAFYPHTINRKVSHRQVSAPWAISRLLAAACLTLAVLACRSQHIDEANRQVYRMIEDRQMATLGFSTQVNIGEETGDIETDPRMYQFTPRSLSAELPAPFDRSTGKSNSENMGDEDGARVRGESGVQVGVEVAGDQFGDTDEDSKATNPSTAPISQDANHRTLPANRRAQDSPSGTRTAELQVAEEIELSTGPEISASIFSDEQLEQVTVFGLDHAMAYAMRHGRDLQNAKEDLYLAALDLSLERHLWTPQFVAGVLLNYTDAAKDAVLDRAMSTISEVSVSQRLPMGGQVTARVIHSLVRDIIEQVSKGESSQVILEGSIPLLRGAGQVAYESRYRTERELIYAVRQYERFRRAFLVSIAQSYFNLQQNKAAVNNIHSSYRSLKRGWFRAEFRHRVGRSTSIAEAPRAQSNFRLAEANLVNTKANYETALDRFKIRIGMPVEQLLNVLDQKEDKVGNAVEGLLVDIEESAAINLALRYRLDLLTNADRIDDERRGVVIAENNILPDLDLTGSINFNSPVDQLRPANLREEFGTWQGGIAFRIDDRKTERNAYRASLIRIRRAIRNHEEFVDTVRADVRRAIRRIREQDNLRRIQAMNVDENEIRLEGAIAEFELGRSTNQNVVDTENELLTARNRLAASVATYRVAILEFRRDTGTLRIDDHGRWGGMPDFDRDTPQPGDRGP